MTVVDLAPAVVVRAPATVNLHLAVGDRPADPTHDVVSVSQAVALYDELRIAPASRLSVTTVGAKGLPRGANNLAGAAAKALATFLGRSAGVAIEITKNIPVSGGLAGACADAAGALVGCAALWGAELTRSELADIGAGIGNEVPFALTGGTAVTTGRGERVAPVLARTPLHWVLAFAERGLSAGDVLDELVRLRERGDMPRAGAVQHVLAALGSGSPALVGPELVNDLQPAAVSLYPELRRTVRAGLAAGAVGGFVVGTGPTVALLAPDAAEADRVAAEMAGSGTCRSVRVVRGPVPGARVVSGG